MTPANPIPSLTPSQMTLFWRKVAVAGLNDCWLCKGTITNRGYGLVYVNKTRLSAHRVAYFLRYGQPPVNLVVMHGCDNPLCVNASHLALGTSPENTADKVKKGRQSRIRGTECVTAKLNEEEVAAMKQEYRSGRVTQKQLAGKYKVAPSLVCRIVNGKSWPHVSVKP